MAVLQGSSFPSSNYVISYFVSYEASIDGICGMGTVCISTEQIISMMRTSDLLDISLANRDSVVGTRSRSKYFIETGGRVRWAAGGAGLTRHPIVDC